MDDEDISERKLKIASILDRVKSFKTKYGTDDNLTDELTFTKSADTTEHSGIFSHLMSPKSPEEWQNCLVKMENTGLPQSDRALLNKLIDNYSRAVDSLPAELHSNNQNYAHILVRFAELKAILDPDEARDQFQLAKLNCKKFAFVHTSFAQFELSQGNIKKSKQILLKGMSCGAVPTAMMQLAMKNLQLKKPYLLSEEDKENLAVSPSQRNQDPAENPSFVVGYPQRIKNESSEELSINMDFSDGEKLSSPEESSRFEKTPLVTLPNKTCTFGRVPFHSVTSPDFNNDESSTSSTLKRQPFSSMRVPNLPAMPKSHNMEDDNFGNIKVPKDHSPTYLQQANEDSLEMKTHSSVIFCRSDSTLTVKGKEDILMTDKDTPQFNLPENNKPSEPEHPFIIRTNDKQPDPPKPNFAEKEWRWKVPETPSDIFPSEGKRMSLDPNCQPTSRRTSGLVHRRCEPVFECKTPVHKPQEDFMNCFRTPVVKNELGQMSQMSTPYNSHSGYGQPQTPANAFLRSGCFPFAHTRVLQPSATLPVHQERNEVSQKMSTPHSSNDCIVIKGRAYAVLKQIGTGGSSKVFQVMDEKKHLFAIKYVDLEEADQQTIESYKNEISHLNKLQQHCDKIIRLYDYEITTQHIYMVMECGNLDLNTWLRKKKNINPWERKSYWKNMLEAVHTIHQHGIVHSDLKPANFLIVDGMLKLIDFGIANQIQPDVTSIVKDSQVGTINYMPPEAIKDNTGYGENGRPRSKISPKGDVWSLGCILYCMTYGKTPFQHITNQISKLHAILDPSHEIEVPDIPERDLQDVLKKCLVRNPKERISIAELLVHPYVQLQPHSRSAEEQVQKGTTAEMKRILGQLIGLNSPNSISRAARSLYDQCSSGKTLDLSAIAKPVNQSTWTLK